MQQLSRISRQSSLLLIALSTAVCMSIAQRSLAEEDLGPLYMQQPFDRVVLKTGETVDVQKLRLPGGARTVPEVLPAAGALKVRPLAAENAAAEYEIPWSGIARIDLFEDMILQEANRLTQAEDFDAAFPYFAHLLKRAKNTRGLEESVARYLQANALAAYNAGEFDRSLAILGSLFDRSPKAAGLAGAVNTVTGKIIEQFMASHNYKSARNTLDVVARTFDGLQLTVVSRWRQRFETAAAEQLAKGQQLLDAHQYLAARQAIAQAVGVWPELDGVAELQQRLQREHPIVTVGVMQRAPRDPQPRIDNTAAARASELVHPTLMELRGYSAEGGEYQTSIGQFELDPTGLEFTFLMADPPPGEPMASALAASALARQLLEATNPSSPLYDAQWATMVDTITVDYPQQVHATLRRAHVRPESLLQFPIPPQVARLSDRNVYQVAEYANNLVRFASTSNRPNSIAEVHEVVFADEEEAVNALSQGTVDVLDRVPPWQVARLKADERIAVDTYKLPTNHGLAPTGRSPLTGQREFRRALCYGIDRETIVSKVLLAGANRPGYQVISGPFPAGVELSDPIRFAYNGQIKPRVYDPYMAIVLSSAAWTNVQKMQGIEDPEETALPVLKLGHTADPVARTVCVEVAKNLNAIGIGIELVELSPSDMLVADQFVDLKYVELAAWEPVVDARRLMGANGELGEASDFMLLALDQLDHASNLNDVREALYQIHDIASTDLPFIPLWQTVNYFAYRRELTGIEQQPVRLYQDIGQWQLAFQTE